MAEYLLVESRQPRPAGAGFLQDAAVLAGTGHTVSLWLVQDGVLAATAARTEVAALVAAGVRVDADDFSLAQRGLSGADLAAGVQVAPIDATAAALLRPDIRVVWH
jgi:hypothetical protein